MNPQWRRRYLPPNKSLTNHRHQCCIAAIHARALLSYGMRIVANHFHIRPATAPDDIAEIARLFQAYASSLPVDLAYQGFAEELDELPGKYAPPKGALLLAVNELNRPIGCVGMRPMPRAGACEMKRLFVAPEGRGAGVGAFLALAIIEAARTGGYNEMYLDTLPGMAAAQQLYRGLGFEPAERYYDTPVEGTVFLRLKLG